jgi:hypothetical protein
VEEGGGYMMERGAHLKLRTDGRRVLKVVVVSDDPVTWIPQKVLIATDNDGSTGFEL